MTSHLFLTGFLPGLVVKQGQMNCSKYDNNLHLTIVKKKQLLSIEKHDSYNPVNDKELGYMCQTCLVWQIPISKPVILAATLTFLHYLHTSEPEIGHGASHTCPYTHYKISKIYN